LGVCTETIINRCRETETPEDLTEKCTPQQECKLCWSF